MRVAGIGPIPITRGATPATAIATMRARGVRPFRFAASSEAIRSAHAPSFTPEAFPAVTVPSGRTIGFRRARPSSVVSARGCSSASTTASSPFFFGRTTGTISSRNSPLAAAAAVFFWLRKAKRSWSSREMRNWSATFSAVDAIDSTPYRSFIRRFTKRHPIVLSCISTPRSNGAAPLLIT